MTSNIRNLRNGLFFLLFLLISHVGFTDMVYEPYLYEQGFEGADPVQFWVASGSYTVNQMGITTDKAFSGAHSYVIDITINSDGYFYWKIPIPDVPCENILNLSGRMWVERVAGTTSLPKLGFNYFCTPTLISGCGGRYLAIFNGWSLINNDVVSYANPDALMRMYVWGASGNNAGAKMDMIGLMITGSTGDRIRVYFDDIKLEGTIPTAASYATEVASRWAPYAAIFIAKMDEYESTNAHAVAQNKIDNLPGDLSAFEQELKTEAQARLDYINTNYNYTTIRNRGWLTPSEHDGIEAWNQHVASDQACGIVDGIYLRRAGEITGINHLLYNVDPAKTTFRNILPNAANIPACIKNEIYITTTPGEYKSASFAVKAFSNLSAMDVTISNLVSSGGGTIASSNVDVRVVKCWYQNGIDTIAYVAGRKILVPELLLKDNSLIDVDTATSNNYIKLNGSYTWISDSTGSNPLSATISSFPVEDSSTLLPVNIASNTLKQFWLTVNAPAGTVAGEYTGDMTFTTPADGEIGKYKITVNVLPFMLENTPLKHSLYYNGTLTMAGTGTISAVSKSTGQFLNDMINMVRHGVKNPTVCQGYTSDLSLLKDALALRTNAGMNVASLYYGGLGTEYSTDSNVLAVLKAKVTNVCHVAANYGITNVYIIGCDEYSGDNLLKEREAWEAVREAGGKVFVAGYAGNLALQYPWGKIGSWHFDEGVGDVVAYDSSENYRNNGTLVNMDTATCWVGGKIGGALHFDGVNDYVYVAPAAKLCPQNEITVEVWINPAYIPDPVAPSGKDWGILSKGIAISTTLESYSLSMRENWVRWRTSYSNTVDCAEINGGILFANTWNHVAGVYKAGTISALYVNGSLVGSTVTLNEPIRQTSAYPLLIGQGGSDPWSYYFNGKIDEVRIYDRALRADEIYKNYQDGINGKWTTVGDLKDLHITYGGLSTNEANKAHEVTGHEIFSYGNPQVGVENPEIYRRNYGLCLGQYDYDGAMDYAYQHSFGHIWNDFDYSGWRDHVFAYPTVNGVIDTIAWEGFREGVDDTRYMATLEKAIDEAQASTNKDNAIAFVNSLKETNRLQYDDLTAVRNEMIGHILKLQGWDVDEDGLPDWWEWTNFGRLSQPGAGDPDGDGLNNLAEYQNGTDPNNPDSDQDGMNDGDEVYHGRNPNSPDSYNTLPFTELFETDTCVIGDIHGQHNWESCLADVIYPAPSGMAVVQTNLVYQGAQALSVSNSISATAPIMVRHLFVSSNNVVWVDMRVRTKTESAPTNMTELSAAMYFNAASYLVVYDGSASPAGGWVTLTNMPPCDLEAWVRLTVGLDYGNQKWLVYVNGSLYADQLGFGGYAGHFTEMRIEGMECCLDNVAVSITNPVNN